MKKFLLILIISLIFLNCFGKLELSRAKKYFENKEYIKAEIIYLKIINNRKKYSDREILEAYNNLYFIYDETKKVENAEAILKEAISVFPNSIFLSANLINFYLKNGRKDDFLKFYEYCISEKKINFEKFYLTYELFEGYYINKANIKTNDPPNEIVRKSNKVSIFLIPFYEKVISINENDIRAKYYLAHNLVNINKYQEAIKYLQECIDNNIEIGRSYYDLGVIYNVLGDKKKALDFFYKAKEAGKYVHEKVFENVKKQINSNQ